MIRRVLNKLGIYRVYPLKVGNKTFRVPIHKGVGFSNFVHSELWMDELLKAFGSDKTKFLDVGMNVGQTLLKWKAIYPKAAYIGFEPNPNCTAYLKKLIKENNFDCQVYPYAVDVIGQERQLYLPTRDKGDSSASMLENFRENNLSHIQIKTTSFKNENLSEFDLVKIDVEGAELFVLKSLFEVCQNAIIICEILPVYSNDNKDRLERQQQIEAILKKHDYLIFRILKTSNAQLELIQEIGIHSELSKSDYVFVPKSKSHLYPIFGQ